MASDEMMGGFGSGMIWIFGIIVLLALLNGNFLGGGNNQAATRDQVQSNFEYSNLLDGNRDIMNSVTAGTAQAVAATNQSFHDTLNVLQDKYGELARDIAGVQVAVTQNAANDRECCCEIKQMILEKSAQTDAQIAQNKFDAALGMAGLEQRLTAKMDQNKIEALQDRVNKLELEKAVGGIPKVTANYPGYIYPFWPLPGPGPVPAPVGV